MCAASSMMQSPRAPAIPAVQLLDVRAGVTTPSFAPPDDGGRNTDAGQAVVDEVRHHSRRR